MGVGGISVWDKLTYGTDIQTDTHMGQTYRQTHIWDRHTDRHGLQKTVMGQTYRQTHIRDRHTVRHTYGTDIQTDTNMGQTYRQTHIKTGGLLGWEV